MIFSLLITKNPNIHVKPNKTMKTVIIRNLCRNLKVFTESFPRPLLRDTMIEINDRMLKIIINDIGAKTVI